MLHCGVIVMCINPQIGNLIPAKMPGSCQKTPFTAPSPAIGELSHTLYHSATFHPQYKHIWIRSDYKCKHTMQNSVFCRKDIYLLLFNILLQKPLWAGGSCPTETGFPSPPYIFWPFRRFSLLHLDLYLFASRIICTLHFAV